jgi:glycosyltransferase involved in cell wall biosynthesis
MSFEVVFLGLPPDLERLKDSRPQTPIGGAQVAERALLQALLRYSKADLFSIVPSSVDTQQEAEQKLSTYDEHRRARLVFPEALAQNGGRRTIILQPTTRLTEGTALRSRAAVDWPLVGLTHALNGSDAMLSAALLASNSRCFGPHDRMVCTSRAAVEAWDLLQLQQRGRTDEPGDEHIALASHLIPLGIEPREFDGPSRSVARADLGLSVEATMFLSFGRLSADTKMDPTTALLAHLNAFSRDPTKILFLAGDSTGGGTSDLRETISRLRLDAQVVVVENPSRRSKRLLYAAADVAVLLSDNLQETFGISVLEAMAAGLPVVASDWSGYRDLVVDGATGFLIPTRWRPDPLLDNVAGFTPPWELDRARADEVAFDQLALTSALRQLAAEPALRRALGRAGRARAVAEFGWSRVIPRYDQLFDTLAGAKERATRSHLPPFDRFHQAFFGYPTSVADLPDEIEFGPTWDHEPARELLPELLAVAAAEAGWPMTTGRLVELLIAAGLRRFEAGRLVRRALKYGLLRAGDSANLR